jgi:hypothetical protein
VRIDPIVLGLADPCRSNAYGFGYRIASASGQPRQICLADAHCANLAARGSDAASLSCVATPEQTEGPYFVDERLHRSDIRVDPSDGSMQEGLPLTLEIRVSSISRGGCKPLVGASVDIWHCDAQVRPDRGSVASE